MLHISKQKDPKRLGATALVVLLLFISVGVKATESERALRYLGTIPLPGVQGRIDHLAIDQEGQRLFVAALGNDSVEIVDLRRGTRVKSISGLKEPQGVFYDGEHRTLYVSNGGDGNVRIFDADTYRSKGFISLSGDADNLHFDGTTGLLYVGYGNGGLGIIDTRTGKLAGDVTLSGHPEGFALERTGPRIFMNIPTGSRISVVNRAQKQATADWPVGCSGNFPMAVDEADRRFFVGCRKPSEVLVLGMETGARTSSLAIGRDVDDLFYDPARKRLYASCGEGRVFAFSQEGPDRYSKIAEIRTRPRARTSLYVPEMHRLFVAAPLSGGMPAGIMVYEVRQ